MAIPQKFRSHDDSEADAFFLRCPLHSQDDETRILIPEGEYVGHYMRRELFEGKDPGVRLYFHVLFDGERYELYRPYNVKSVDRRQGRFKVSPNHHLAREFANLYRAPYKNSFTEHRALQGRRVHLRVRTVRQDWDKEPLEEWNQYSIIGKLIAFADAEGFSNKIVRLPH